MKRLVLPVLLLAVSLPAATIGDTDTIADLHSGDALAFQVLTWNFGFNAARFGLPRYPTDIGFSVVTAPVDGDVPFSAWIEAPDGSSALPFAGSMFFTPGLLSSTQYTGDVSTLSGYLHLTATQSNAIFGTGSAILLLVDDGGDITLGLPPNTLHNDLRVSLSGGPLSVGALAGAVNLQIGVPEPSMWVPILAALALLSTRHARNSEL